MQVLTRSISNGFLFLDSNPQSQAILPRELIVSILSFFDSRSFFRSSLVCKEWQNITNHFGQEIIEKELRIKGYRDRVFGPKEWESIHGIKTNLQYPKNLCMELDQPSPFFREKTVGQTSYVQSVADIKNCKALVKMVGDRTQYYEFAPTRFKRQVSLSATEWYIVSELTNRNMKFKDQLSFIEKVPQYRIGTIFEISLVVFNQFLSTSDCMLNALNGKRPLFTRAISTGKTNSVYNLGGFDKNFGFAVIEWSRGFHSKQTGVIYLKDIGDSKSITNI